MSMEWYQEIALENIYEEIVDELLKTDLSVREAETQAAELAKEKYMEMSEWKNIIGTMNVILFLYLNM